MKQFLINLMPNFLVRTFASPYVSGDSIEKGVDKADELWQESSISSTLDLLGEEVDTKEMVEYNIETYQTLINQLEGKEYATISLKPTSLGIHDSFEYCEQSLRKILEVASDAYVPVTIDMEDHNHTDITLDLYTTLLEDFPTLGTVLQSRLFRTDDDIENLASYDARIRICIGIYNEPKDIALQKKSEMKEKMVEQTKMLLDDGQFVEVATQDKKYIREILEKAEEWGAGPDNLEFQQLLGVPIRDMQNEILEQGYTNRLYVPFATDWKYAHPYLKRRLANNPKMAWYVMNQTVAKLFGKR